MATSIFPSKTSDQKNQYKTKPRPSSLVLYLKIERYFTIYDLNEILIPNYQRKKIKQDFHHKIK